MRRRGFRFVFAAMCSLALLVGLTLATAQEDQPVASGTLSCLAGWSPEAIAAMDRSRLLQDLHRGLDCPVVEDQQGLQAALWDAIGRLSVNEPAMESFAVARGVLEMTARISDLGERVAAGVPWAEAGLLLADVAAAKQVFLDERPGHLAALDAPKSQSGVVALEDLAALIGVWFTTAGHEDRWMDDAPLSEGERVESLRLAAEAYTVAGLYAFAATLQADWVQREAPYRAAMERADSIEAAVIEHTARWASQDASGRWLSAVFWYGTSARLGSDLEWALLTLDAYDEPHQAALSEHAGAFAVAKSEAGRIVLQIFAIGLIAAVAVSIVVLRAQNRWAQDFRETGLGSELLWRNSQ